MDLPQSPVVGRVLVHWVPQIPLCVKWPSWVSLMRWWWRAYSLWCMTLSMSLCAILLNKSPGDGWPNHLTRCDGDFERLAESYDQSWKSQGPVGLIRVHRVPGRRHTYKQINGIVATYPSAGGRRVTRGCVFQERNTRGVATNIYLRNTSEKPEKTWSTNFKWKVRELYLRTGKVLALHASVTRDDSL